MEVTFRTIKPSTISPVLQATYSTWTVDASVKLENDANMLLAATSSTKYVALVSMDASEAELQFL
jgi:hypothetical protein